MITRSAGHLKKKKKKKKRSKPVLVRSLESILLEEENDLFRSGARLLVHPNGDVMFETSSWRNGTPEKEEE